MPLNTRWAMLADGFGNYLKQYADLSGDPEVARYVALADQMGLTNSKADYIVTPEERQFINAVIAQNPEFAALYQQAIINADSNNPGQDLNKAYYRYQDETIRTAASAKADGFEPALCRRQSRLTLCYPPPTPPWLIFISRWPTTPWVGLPATSTGLWSMLINGKTTPQVSPIPARLAISTGT